ncbi:type II toxin-antitoxin system RelE/ParE family toxin [Azotobacter chroococcum]|uniref:Type II toxin-antitoxin system RelE/ParE family toxin n=1 Tax=Azotobacter chroococcum TaxID=353 RepID=A0AAP9YIA3_9GAMM|nr:type II toxin-antitoxin system RelE/ParE family toxin [Azotobacter chroococcum]QQE91188.1 type II toxin-antitoxin system RelE/ParE family toxin [Azotobacter chroococcum]
MSFDVQFATTAETSLFSQIAHLEPYHGYDGAYGKLSTLVAEVIRRLADHPLGYPISAQASELGITHYRELNLDGYRVFYECDEEKRLVVVLLILGQRQSNEQQLIHYCLMFAR